MKIPGMMETKGLVFLMSDEMLFSARQTWLHTVVRQQITKSAPRVVVEGLNDWTDRGNYSLFFSHDTLQQLA